MKCILAALALLAGAASAQTPPGPVFGTVEGQPIDARAPEQKKDTRQFPQQTRAPYHHATDFQRVVVADGLRKGWASIVLPSGRILITEHLPGSIRLLEKGKLSEPLTGLDALHPDTPQILVMDVQADPDYARNHTIFFAYSEYWDKTIYNTAIARAVVDEDAHALRDVKSLLTTIPFVPNDQNQTQGGKSGGRIAIGPDGYLYVTIGDRDNAGGRPWAVAQYLDTHLGKMLRITKDGAPAPGNPFIGVARAQPEIWAYGLRSQEGLAFAPNGELYETEHGPRGGDELNLIKKGANYGWPVISHGVDYTGKPNGDGIVAKDGMEQPVYYWSPSLAPAGLAFYTGKSKAWSGSVFVPMLNGRTLIRLKLKDGKAVEEEALLSDLHSRIRDARMGPDGFLYVFTDPAPGASTENGPATGQLIKLVPAR